MPENDPIDILIEAALSTYATPGPGLEQRVLASVSGARISTANYAPEPTPGRRWLPWAIALPVAASLLLSIVLVTPTPKPPPTVSVNRVPLPAASIVRTAPPTKPHHSASGNSRIAPAATPLPKLDVFPTPQPLTPQEQALAVFAAKTPLPKLHALADAQMQADAPLNIAAIDIQPLDPSAQSGN